MDETLLNYSNQIRKLLEKSEKTTQYSIQSINRLEDLIDNIKKNSPAIDHFEKQKLISTNLTKAAQELEDFIRLTNCINNDELGIRFGPQDLINDYIRKLNYLKTFYKYSSDSTDGSFIKLTISNLKKLLEQANNYLSVEFERLVKHYSDEHHIELFIDYLINVSTEELFLPADVVAKLDDIINWFVKQEDDYEFCDLNEKVNFSDIRNNFLKSLIHSVSKMSSFDLYKSKLKNKLHSLKSHSESLKAVEYISLFAENLNLFIKMIMHENNLINRIYSNADENTRVNIVTQLTVVIIKNIQVEFEKFFINSFDFSKLSYNGDQVLREIINLNVKVDILKKKTVLLKSEDIESASKFLKFSIKLNELTSLILSNYLIVIRNGYFNLDCINSTLRVHSFCVQTLQSLRIIYMNKECLSEAINLCIKDNSTTETDDFSNYERFITITSKNQFNENDSIDSQFKIYSENLIKNLCCFLLIESNNIDSSRFKCFHSKYKILLKEFKKNIFLINNYDFIIDFLNELNIELDLEELNLQKHINESCKLFTFLTLKVAKLDFLNEKNSLTKQGISTNLNLNKNKREEFIDMLIEVLTLCMNIVIPNLKANETIKNYITFNLDSIFKKLFDSEIEKIFVKLNINKLDDNLITNICNKIF